MVRLHTDTKTDALRDLVAKNGTPTMMDSSRNRRLGATHVPTVSVWRARTHSLSVTWVCDHTCRLTQQVVFDTTDGAIVLFGSAGTEVRDNDIYSRTRIVLGGELQFINDYCKLTTQVSTSSTTTHGRATTPESRSTTTASMHLAATSRSASSLAPRPGATTRKRRCTAPR